MVSHSFLSSQTEKNRIIIKDETNIIPEQRRKVRMKGMVLAIFLGFSGIITKYRLAPKSLHPAIFKFHSSILVTLAMSFLVVGGHVLIDD
jgi:hypothetical protein